MESVLKWLNTKQKNQIEYSEEYVEKDKIECRREAKK